MDADQVEGIAVFPANAGMILGNILAGSSEIGVPRECGDDPYTETSDHKTVECSPRMRG